MGKNQLKIEFFDVFPDLDFSLKIFRSFVKTICRHEHIPVGLVRIIGVNDEYLRTLHQKFLHDDRYSDVMVFPLDDETNGEAEIYISLERAKANAKTYRVTIQKEIARLICHALLHLKGFEDHTEARRKKNAGRGK